MSLIFERVEYDPLLRLGKLLLGTIDYLGVEGEAKGQLKLSHLLGFKDSNALENYWLL